MGKYGTNLEGFGAFEGGVNTDKGATLVSTSSDGATALLFGPAALREIQAGVANGDFAIPPDAAGDTITEENPLPYWTFTDVNSAGAITAAIVADSTAPAGFALQWSVLAGTGTGKSATITRNVPVVPGTGTPTVPSFYSIAYRANYSYTGVGTADAAVGLTIKYEYYDSSDTDLTTTPPESAAITFTGTGTSGGDTTFGYTKDTLAPVNAAYAKITITCATTGTVGGTAGTFRRHNIHNVRLLRDPLGIAVPGLGSGGNDPIVSLYSSDNTLEVSGSLAITGDTTDLHHGVTLQRTTNLTVNTSVDASATAITWSSAVKNTSRYDYWSTGSTIAIPLTGWYSVTCHLISGTGLGTGFAFRLYALVNGTVIAETETQAGANTTSDTFSISTIAYMTAGNSLVFRASASAASKTIGGSRRSACSVVYLGNTSA
jgi:hypothetical protein